MTPASTLTHQFTSHSRSNSPTPTGFPCARSASYPPTTFTTSSRAGSHGGSSVLQKLCGFFSPRKLSPSSSAENKHGFVDAPEWPPLMPTTASNVNADTNGAEITASTRRRRSGEGFEKVFRYFDENGDGKISPSELRGCMKAVGKELSAEDAEALVESTDSDGDGLLGFDDFVKLVDVGGEEERSRDLREAFGMYEMKGQGSITPKSLRRTLRQLGEFSGICSIICRAFLLQLDVTSLIETGS